MAAKMQRLLQEEAAAASATNTSQTGRHTIALTPHQGFVLESFIFSLFSSVLSQERQRAAEAQAELLKVEVQVKAVPVELDAARAAEAAARGQLERQREGMSNILLPGAFVESFRIYCHRV